MLCREGVELLHSRSVFQTLRENSVESAYFSRSTEKSVGLSRRDMTSNLQESEALQLVSVAAFRGFPAGDEETPVDS